MPRGTVITSTGSQIEAFEQDGVHTPASVMRGVSEANEAQDVKVSSTGQMQTVADGYSVATATRPGNRLAVTTASQQLLAAAPRRYLMLVNLEGPGDIWISLGGVAAANQGIPIPLGGSWEMPEGARYVGAVNALATATSNVTVVEY